MQLVVRPDPLAASAAAADRIARRLVRAVHARGSASLAVSGGRTGGLLFDALADHREVPWSSVDVFQVDERHAPDGHPDRNAVDLVERLARPVDLPARRLHLMPVTATDPRAAARRYSRLVAAPIDVVHLGLGDDGHTASWPPGDLAVVASSRAVELVDTYRGRSRLTLTPRVVNAAHVRVVLVTGADKAAPLRAWVGGRRDLPVANLRRSGTIVVADAAAAPHVTEAPEPSGGVSHTG